MKAHLCLELLEGRIVPVHFIYAGAASAVAAAGAQSTSVADLPLSVTGGFGSPLPAVATAGEVFGSGSSYQLRSSADAGAFPAINLYDFNSGSPAPYTATARARTEAGGSAERATAGPGLATATADATIRGLVYPGRQTEVGTAVQLRVRWTANLSSFVGPGGGAVTTHARIEYTTAAGGPVTVVYDGTLSAAGTDLKSGELVFPAVVGPLVNNDRYPFTFRVVLSSDVGGLAAGDQRNSLSAVADVSLRTDIEAVSPPASNIRGTSVGWNVDRDMPGKELARGLDFRYEVDGPGVNPIPVQFYYATGPRYEDRIGGRLGETTVGGAAGPSDVVNERARWPAAPVLANYVLVVLDGDNVIPEAGEPATGVAADNVLALRIHSQGEILSPTALSVRLEKPSLDGGLTAIRATFRPGYNPLSLDPDIRQGLTVSEAEVALGVDHFNWLQLITDQPSHWTRFRELPDGTKQTIPLPATDPDSSGVDASRIGVYSTRALRTKYLEFEAKPLDALPYYYQEVSLPDAAISHVRDHRITTARSLNFYDQPAVPAELDPLLFQSFFGPGESQSFRTALVGVDASGGQVPLPVDLQFSWRSNATKGFFSLAPLLPAPLYGDVNLLRAAGSAPGSDAGVTVYNSDGAVANTLRPFPGYTGGVQVATADVNRDGAQDIIAGTGVGAGAEVVVVDGATQAELTRIRPFEQAFTGGVYLATGDFTGDGIPEIVVSAGEGGSPRVLVYNGADFALLADFFGLADPDSRAGARVAVADVTGDAIPDLIVTSGFGGGARLAVWSGASLDPVRGKFTAQPYSDILVFEPDFRGGLYVAAADVDNDGVADLIVGAGKGGAPRVRILSGRLLLAGEPAVLTDFFAADPGQRAGTVVRVPNADTTGGAPDLMIYTLISGVPHLLKFAGASLAGPSAPEIVSDTELDAEFLSIA